MALSGPNFPQPLTRLGGVNACSAQGGIIYATGIGRTFFWGGDEPAAGDYPAPGALWVDTTNAIYKYNSGTMASPSWTSGSSASVTLDGAYNSDTGERTVTVDAGSIVFDCSDSTNDYALVINNTSTSGALAAALTIDSEGANSTITKGIVFGTTGTSAAITTAIDASDAGITTALAFGAGKLTGTYFTVSETGATVCVGLNYGSGSLVGTGNIAISTSKFVVTGATGATRLLSITGLDSSDLAIAASATTNQALTLNGGGSGTVGIAGTSTGNVTIGNGSVTQIGLQATTVAVTGNLTVSGTISGTYSISSLSASTLTFTGTAGTSGTAVIVNGNSVTTGNVLVLSGDGLTTGKFVSADVGGSEKFSVEYDGAVTIAGTAAADTLTITAGDVVFSDGSITLTDADNATSLSVTNNTITSQNLAVIAGSAAITGIGLYLNLAGLTTGKGLSVAVPALTSGAGVYISATEGAGLTGKYIQCYDGAADDFSVSRHGATVITGSAGGTAALTLTSGDVVLSAGRLNVTSTTDVANSLVRSVASAGTDPVLTIQASNAASTKECLFINADGTGASLAVQVDHEGTGDCITITSKAAAASLIKATAEAATGTILELAGAANSTVSLVLVDGATADWIGASGVGMVQLTAGTTVLAHAAASLFRIANTAQPANTPTAGVCVEIADTGAAAGAGTAYQLHITSTNNEALWVESGTCLFSEAVTVAAALTVGSGSATGVLQSNGNYDVTLQTGNATTGTITITDGANGNITVTPNGSGRIACVGAAVADDSFQDYVVKVYRYAWTHADPDGNNDIQLFNANSPKMNIINAWMDNNVAEGGAMTATIRTAASGGGTAIAGSMDCNTTNVDYADALTTVAVAAGSSMYLNFSGNPGTAEGTLYLLYVETA